MVSVCICLLLWGHWIFIVQLLVRRRKWNFYSCWFCWKLSISFAHRFIHFAIFLNMNKIFSVDYICLLFCVFCVHLSLRERFVVLYLCLVNIKRNANIKDCAFVNKNSYGMERKVFPVFTPILIWWL